MFDSRSSKELFVSPKQFQATLVGMWGYIIKKIEPKLPSVWNARFLK